MTGLFTHTLTLFNKRLSQIAPPISERGLLRRFAFALLLVLFGSIQIAFAQTTTVSSVPVNNAPTSDTPGSVNVTLQGDGTSEHPLEIGSVNEWNAFATYVNSNTDHKTAQAIITADITFTNNYLQPNGFRGTLDGQGHTIILHQSDSQECGKFPELSASSCWGGLFFKTYGNATIKNLRLAGEIKNNKYDCGTFVQNANSSTTIDNCQSSVEIIKTADGNGNNGGMIGGNDDINSDITIRNSLVDGKFSVSGGNFSQNGNGGFMGRLNDSRKFLTVNNSYAHPAIDNSNYTNYTDFYPFCNTPDQSQGVATPTINYSYYKFPDGFNNLVTTGPNQGTNRAATGNTTTIVSNLNTNATKVTINNEQVNPWIAHNDTVYLRTFAKYVHINDWTYGKTASTPSVVGNNGNGNVTYYYKLQTEDDTEYTETPPTAVGKYTVKAVVAAANGWNGWESTMDFEINALPYYDDENEDRIILYNLPLRELGTTVTLMGKGTSAKPFEIDTPDKWDAFATIVNMDGGIPGAFAKLTADITFTGNHQQPGEDADFSFTHTAKMFSGMLKGEGHTITLCQQETGGKSNTASRGGLFGDIASGTTYLVRDLNLAGTIRTTKSKCGAIASSAFGFTSQIENCQSSVDIIWASNTIGDFIGGLIGWFNNDGSGGRSPAYHWTIENCMVNGTFSSEGGNITTAGGFVGRDYHVGTSGNYNYLLRSYSAPRTIDGTHYPNFYTFAAPYCATKFRQSTSYYLFPESITPANANESDASRGKNASGMASTAIVGALNTVGSDTQDAWVAHNDTVYLKTFAKYVDITGWEYGSTANEPSVYGNNGGEQPTYKYKVQGADDDTYAIYTPGTTVLGAGSYTLKACVAKANGWNAWESTMDFTITPKPVTISGITASDKVYDGTTTATIVTSNATLDGKVTNDDLTVSTSGTFSDKTVGVGKTVTFGALTLGGTSKDNYQLAASGQQETTTADITAKTAELNWSDESFDYDGTAKAPTCSVSNLVDGDNCNVTVSVGVHSAVGTYTATASGLTGADRENYALPAEKTHDYEIVRPMTGIEFTASKHWNTYYAFENLATPTGLTAYIVTGVNGTAATTSEIGYIPEGVGVLLYSANVGSDFKASAYTGAAGSFTANKLNGSTSATALDSEAGYILYGDAFVLTTGGTLPANRCYLPANMGAGTRSLTIDGGDGTTSLHKVNSEEMGDDKWFDLQGQRIEKPHKKGLYIKDGKKVVIK